MELDKRGDERLLEVEEGEEKGCNFDLGDVVLSSCRVESCMVGNRLHHDDLGRSWTATSRGLQI